MRQVRAVKARAGFRRVVLAAALVAYLATGCGTPGGQRAGSGPRPAPDFALEDIHGKLVRLSDSAGKVRLVDFWATWCPPCLEEIPSLKELHEAYAAKGLAILAISMDDEPAKVVPPFVNKHAISYTNLLGTAEVAEAFGGVVGLPTIFLVDRNGTITDTYVGGTPKTVLERRIRELLEAGAAL